MYKYFNLIFKLFFLLPSYLIRFLCSLIKRENNLWVFGAWNGEAFADNTKYLFLHMVEHHKDIKVFWVTKNRAVLDELLELNLPVLYLYSLKGIITCIKAGKQLTTHSLYDIAPTLTKGSTHYCLFHVTFPLKRMEFNILKDTWRKKVSLLIDKPFVFEKADYSICSSRTTSKIIQSALSLEANKVIETGYPRSNFLDSAKHLKTDLKRISTICEFDKYNNFIYFVPTFRHNPKFNWFNFGYNQEKLIELLETTNSILIFRFHPFELSKIDQQRKLENERIIFESHGLSDPYPLLSRASILITDYSSIFSDFLLLDKPIIFSNFDHHGYINDERALYWDYDEMTPGAKVSDWSSLIIELHKILVDDEDDYKKERKRMTQLIYQQPVNKSLAKVTELVMR